MRCTFLRVSGLTSGLSRKARDTVACETPARCAMSNEVVFPEPNLYAFVIQIKRL
jgi:hypothetical protein